MRHELFDKRQRRPRIVSIESEGKDFSMMMCKDISYGKAVIHYWPPNLAGIFLNVASFYYEKAANLHKTHIKPFQSRAGKVELNEDQTILVYDFIESMQVSIIMIITTIECLTNSVIPSDFVYKKDSSKKTLTYEKIQFKVSHIEKLEVVLKQSLGIDVTKTTFWKRYKILYSMRNDLVHMKSRETSTTSDQRKFFNNLDEDIIIRLVNDKSLSYLKAGFDLMKFLGTKVKNSVDIPLINKIENLTVEKVYSMDEIMSKTKSSK